MNLNIGITEDERLSVSNSLARLLADEFLLYTKTYNAHWNVEDSNFHAMHKFFEEQYTMLAEIVDSVAERIRALGHYVPATMKDFLALTHLTEKRSNANDSQSFVKALLNDHENIIVIIREDIKSFADMYNDAGSSDFITGVMEQHEKAAWMLRAHLV